MRLKKTVYTQLTLFTYIQSVDPDLVKCQLDVESINTSSYMCTYTVYVSVLCKHMSYCVTKVVS